MNELLPLFASVLVVRPIVAIALITLFTACGAPPPQADETTSTQTVATSTVVAVGKIIPEGEVIKVSVSNAADSRVNRILVEEGDLVEENQVIAILQGADRREADLQAAEVNVQLQRANLQKAQQGDAKPGDLSAQRAAIARLEAQLQSERVQNEAAIVSAEATLREAELTFQRRLALAQEEAITRSDLDEAQRSYETARADVAQRQAELNQTLTTLQAQLTEERARLEALQQVLPVDVAIAEAELENAQIEVAQRRADLEDVQVRAPAAGQILKINTRIGEQVNTSDGIVELAQTRSMFAMAEVYETDITRVKVGQRATINSEYGGFEGELAGTVEHIGLQIGATTLSDDEGNPNSDINARVVEVKIRLDSEDSTKVAALTNMQVRVRIDVANVANRPSPQPPS